MTEPQESTTDPIRGRIAREHLNIFSRLPPVYTASRQQGAKFLARCGNLSTVEWRTLWDLHEAGPMTIRQLAVIQRADHSLLSRALPDMRRKGLVTMARDRSDGRQTIVKLTPAGRAAYDRAAPVMARRRAALAEVFSAEEIRAFVGYLDRLEAFLRLPVETHFETEETP
ncbi:MarR family winged helix-turn-helix transcriptional regulator [Salipiger sp. IMCC34102]|uniref:MarR family winged helix-turn-helix transcriptional regulator n=1 Tax=Salipiger sp. IMCC34102 TaxID=2510647 RepID=UPI0013EB5C1F|nr:winged helix DNA-binding protein [Salipiger sp. IMCC34102]